MTSQVRPRRDQVAELTRGVRLPMAPMEDVFLEILAEGIQQAFTEILTSSPITVATGEEAEVTTLMQTRLNTLIQRDSLFNQLVLCVVRGMESISFDGSHLEKRPDLSILLSGGDLRFPLVVEAKILDKPKSKTATTYCKSGIRRFVEGEYAWGNRDAMMFGYVRDGSAVVPTLKKVLTNAMKRHPARYEVQVFPVAVRTSPSNFAHTRHGRNFVYQNQAAPNTPGPITIWHLWLG